VALVPDANRLLREALANPPASSWADEAVACGHGGPRPAFAPQPKASALYRTICRPLLATFAVSESLGSTTPRKIVRAAKFAFLFDRVVHAILGRCLSGEVMASFSKKGFAGQGRW
jgi:hypothetical protein